MNERLVVAGIRMQELADEADAARRRLALLAEAAQLLGASFDTASVLPTVAELLVPDLGDECAIRVTHGPGAGSRLSAAPGPVEDAAAQALERAARMSLARGDALVLSPLEAAGSPERAALLRTAGAASFLAVPLHDGTATRGALTLFARTRRHDSEDVALAKQIAGRIAIAVERAELHQQALDAVRARDDLLAAVSHDLRTPLQAIAMSASILASRGGVEEGGAGSHVARIQRAAEQMERLIRDLVDAAKMQAGCFTIERRPCDLASLVTEVVDTMTPSAASKSIHLEARLDDAARAAAGLTVSVDQGRLLQVLENLVGNAIKFTPAGGSVTVGAERRADDVRLWVRDTGPGIPAAQLPRLFDRFWQAQQTARLGAGLGLFIAKSIVKAHGGELWAESALGAGSTFFVVLPAAAPQELTAKVSGGAP